MFWFSGHSKEQEEAHRCNQGKASLAYLTIQDYKFGSVARIFRGLYYKTFYVRNLRIFVLS